MNENSSSLVENRLTDLKKNSAKQVLSVSEISTILKRAVEDAFGKVKIQGEISGFKRAQSGHLYFSLKDNSAAIDSVCWRGNAKTLKINPEDGMEVIVTGKLTTYSVRSRYQIVIEDMELAGEGALLKLLEDRRRKLAAEGLFDIDKKKPIPFLPAIIGIITSETGAVFSDILHRLNDRFPRRVILWPVTVQGSSAADEIAFAIEGFNKLSQNRNKNNKQAIPCPDILIVARGGGSLEDLMAFNEERVVRAAATSRIPLVSAVGHETDNTLIDYVADKRAPTPTAAAEMVVPVRTDLMVHLETNSARLVNAISRLLKSIQKNLDTLTRTLPELKRLVDVFNQRLDDWTERLFNSIHVFFKNYNARLMIATTEIPKPKQQIEYAKRELSREARALKTKGNNIVLERQSYLQQITALLESYSYQRVLERGFSLVTSQNHKPIDSINKISTGMPVSLQFQDGKTSATITGEGQKKNKSNQIKNRDNKQRKLL